MRALMVILAILNWLLALIPSTIEQPSGWATGQGSEHKLVTAHFVVGNTVRYGLDDWIRDMTLAASKGIDAFALHFGRSKWQMRKVADAYTAAKALNEKGIAFKLFPSFDMTSIACATERDADVLKNYVYTYWNHPSQVWYRGKMFVTTFRGSHCRFGQKSMDKGWLMALKSGPIPVYLVTAFFGDPALYGGYLSPDGALAWNAAWPTGNYSINGDYDQKYVDHLGGRTYMATVSPWFFTHYGRNSYNKNFIYRGDDWLFAARWELLIAQREKVNLVEVISWNGYGESHYLGPIIGPQPGWTNGFDHQGWLDLMQYYIVAFKTGNFPNITHDRVFLWGRLSPKDADAPNDPIGKPRNWQFTQDKIWAVVLLKETSRINFTCGLSALSVALPAGVSKVSLEQKEECTVVFVVTRMNTPVLEFAPSGYLFSKHPSSYNFNAFVAASPA